MDRRSRFIKTEIEEGIITDLYGIFDLIKKEAFARSISVSKPRLNRMCREPLSITWRETYNIAMALTISRELSKKLVESMIARSEQPKEPKTTRVPAVKEPGKPSIKRTKK